MAYGEGASVALWAQILPNAARYVLEYDRACGEKWGVKGGLKSMFIGSQSDEAFLKGTVLQAVPQWSIIVDDGGHGQEHQRVSFLHLFPALTSGGIYVIEDLLTSYLPGYGGVDDPSADLDNWARTTVSMAQQIMGLLARSVTLNPAAYAAMIERVRRTDPIAAAMAPYVLSVDCFRELCVFVKK